MDFYVILGVERGATLADVKRAYKRLARKYHPDINPGDRMAAAQFRQIAEAYETLSDPDRRRRYDTTGAPRTRRRAAARSASRDSISRSACTAATRPTFGDLFADVFHQRDDAARRAAAERGADLHQTLTLGFEEAMRGGQRPSR